MSQQIKCSHEPSEQGGVFYLREDGDSLAHLDYRRPSPSQVVVTYVEVDPAQRGRGLARRLVQQMVDYREAEAFELEATCGVARAILKKMGEL